MDSILIALFAQGAALGLTAAASPGPLQTLLISEALIGGFKRAAPIAFAPLVTDVPIVGLMLIVLKQLPPIAIRGLSMAGGLYVLYLAWSLWKQWRAGVGQDYRADNVRVSVWTNLRRGALTNFLNPNPYLFWGTVGGPILLSAFDQSVLYAASFVIGMYGVMIGAVLALAAVFHHARRLGPRLVRGLLFASILILIAFGGLLIYRGLLSS
jgi:threonine/homoserine/homoserine lactone efflux protein